MALEQPLLRVSEREPRIGREAHAGQLLPFLVAVDAAPERLLVGPEDEPDSPFARHPSVHQRFGGEEGSHHGALVVLRAAAVQHAVDLDRIEGIVLPVFQLAGGHYIQVAQDADQLLPVAHLGKAVIPAVAAVGAKPEVAGDLQRLAQCLVDRLAERVSAPAFRAHAGNAHQLDERRLQRRVLSFQVPG
jgi:hypothetical protein